MKGRPKETKAELAVIAGVLIYITLLALFAIRNNDIWWHMAVGKTILETRHFITTDPFSFALVGTPWVPQSWLAGLVFYVVHAVSSASGLVVLRAVLVASTFVFSVRVLKRVGISLTLAAPLILVVALNAHSRFILRPHLFEYLFLVLLIGHLVGVRTDKGRRFFVLPLVIQALWVNMHASYFLGPLVVVLFYTGEWMSRRMSTSLHTVPVLEDSPAVNWRRVGMLLVLMIVASLANPNPIAFISQPLNGEQQELLTQYTLEWRSPFDPSMVNAAFHPYYEMLLVTAGLVFVIALRRLQLTSLLLIGLFAVLSLKAHRFRVEFGLAVLFFASAQLRAAPLFQRVATRLAKMSSLAARLPYGLAIVATAALMVTARDRIVLDGVVSDRFPAQAMDFLREHDLGKRTFQSIGFGSYQIWKLYPERQTFVDGRNISGALYQDFLSCQTSSAGFNAAVRKYEFDAFLIPAPERSDGGMANLHGFLSQGGNWALVHMDRNAYIYVRSGTVPSDWLERHAYRVYHPRRFADHPPHESQWGKLADELDRAVQADPYYLTPLLDMASFAQFTGDTTRALPALKTAIERGGDPAKLLPALYQQYAARTNWTRALEVAQRFREVRPADPLAWFYAGWAQLGLGKLDEAMALAQDARARFPEDLDARLLTARVHIARRDDNAAAAEINAVLARDPQNQQALSLRAMLGKPRN